MFKRSYKYQQTGTTYPTESLKTKTDVAFTLKNWVIVEALKAYSNELERVIEAESIIEKCKDSIDTVVSMKNFTVNTRNGILLSTHLT